MNKSDSIKNLAEALHGAQAEMPPVPMDSVNPFLKNKFASLGSVINTTRPVLERHGLSISQFPMNDNGWLGITTILMHVSGEWLEATVTLPLVDEKGKSGAQVAGSIISYLRRYSLSAILGLYSDEDTDGESVVRTQSRRKVKTNRKPPSDITELYQMAKDRFGHEHTKHTLNIMQSYLDEQHGGGTIKAYLQMEPDNIKVLWAVLVEHEEARTTELEE